MPLGGKRPGAGRKPGGKNKATKEKQAIMAAFNQRVMVHADNLFNAQLQLAIGSIQIFRIDEEGTGKNAKRTHTLVTSAKEIKDVLDGTDGQGGVVGDDYYIVTDVAPDNRAIDSMLNRALGKPKDSVEVTGKDGNPQEIVVKFT